MALIKCRECGKEIADSAPTCPGCGAPSIGKAFFDDAMAKMADPEYVKEMHAKVDRQVTKNWLVFAAMMVGAGVILALFAG